QAVNAEGRLDNIGAALADAWAQRMEREKLNALVRRRDAARNIIIRNNLDTFREQVKAEGFTGMDALEAVLVGSNKRFTGARNSIDANRIAIKRDFMGGMINELERIEGNGGMALRKLLDTDREFNRNIVREVISPNSTGNATARAVADVFSRHLEKTRLRQNAAGANIGWIEGYLPQSHDAWKMTAGTNARQKWINNILGRLDVERSFGAVSEQELTDILSRVYDDITLGKADLAPAERGISTTGGREANRSERHRVLHFKDADSWMAYHERYGRGHVLDGVFRHMDRAARSVALMESLGSNPERMLRSIIAEEIRELREKSAGGEVGKAELKALVDLQAAEGLKQGKVMAWWMELTGEANAPGNPTAARVMAIARAVQSMSKLGGAALSAVGDVYVKAMNIRTNSGLNWAEAVMEALAQYFRAYNGQERKLAREFGAFINDVSGEIRLRWDMNESIPGKLAAVQDKLFRWSGLNWITETGKSGYAMWLSRHLGASAGKAFDKLDAQVQAMLKYHGVDARQWEALRRMTETAPDGKTLLVPSKAADLPDDVLAGLRSEQMNSLQAQFKDNPEGFAKARQRLLEDARRDLRTSLMSLISDETSYAIIESNAKSRAFMRQGRSPGTLAGEVWRTMMQFKSFPVTYLIQEFGGRRWVRGDRQAGLRRGFNLGSVKDTFTYDMAGAAGAAVAAFIFGYLAMSLKDLAKGRTPRDPTKKETVFAALAQSGGAGILGDFFFSRASRFGDSFAGTLAGPLTVEVGRAVTAVQEMMRGEFGKGGEDALRIVMDNTPFINLWYLREGMNWAALYHLREMMSPGTLRRTERKLKEEYNQTGVSP
ncbi:MAG: hypothetical protein LBB52_06400, partial [Desulfovibrio sp.]|nr:hypothetical protein [Desulfovibrio sp.]